ncbi:MAG: peroxide stress protein YaaA [Bacteroidetes bacterium]|nr:peroxide stress protein YaaA [Bacteroidota bacterium]
MILSPAKSIDDTIKTGKLKTSLPGFLTESQVLVDKLKKLSPKKISALMDISPDLAALNFDRFQKWKLPFTEKNAKPCACIFTGAAYQGLDFTSLSAKEQERAQRNLRILSGLYGILKPFDLIQPYRLEMGTSLVVNSKVKNLYQFWGDKIRRNLEEELQSEKNPVLINVASSEYFKAAQLEKLPFPVITCVFKDRSKSGDYKVNMTFAKQARGKMTRFILQHDLKKAEDLKAFNSAGYYFWPKASSPKEFVFLRDKVG